MTIGPAQLSILRSVHGGQWFDADSNRVYRVCMRLEARRLLARDPMSVTRFTSTGEGDALIEMHDADERLAA